MPFRKWVPLWQQFAWVPGAENLLLVPDRLPFRLNQVERILFAANRHKRDRMRVQDWKFKIQSWRAHEWAGFFRLRHANQYSYGKRQGPLWN